MIHTITKGLAFCGLCALFAGAASAQGDFHPHNSMHTGAYHHGSMHRAHHAIRQQKEAYAHAVAQGHYRAAEKAHLRAMAIRHHVRAHREMHREHGV